MPRHPIWFTRPSALATFGPAEAHALDAALLAHLADERRARARDAVRRQRLGGHEIARSAEALCIAQYLAQHAAVLALLRARGVRVIGLLTAVGHSAAFFVNGLQASHVYALAVARVVAMEPDAIARVTKQDEEQLAALIENDPLIGPPVRHFASWGGIDEILPELSHDRLVALAAREQGDAPS